MIKPLFGDGKPVITHNYLSPSRYIHALHSAVNGKKLCKCGDDVDAAEYYGRYFSIERTLIDIHLDVKFYELFCWEEQVICKRLIFWGKVGRSVFTTITIIGDYIVLIADSRELARCKLS